jgi:hypothetical protein
LGTSTPKVAGGNIYFPTIVDDFSRYCEITPLRNKSQAFDALKAYIAQKETQLDRKVKGCAQMEGQSSNQTQLNSIIQTKA